MTSVDFAVKTFWGLTTVHGRFDRFDGAYEVGPDGTKIELTIDVDSLDTGNAMRDKHLRSTTSSISPSTRRCGSRRRVFDTAGDGMLPRRGHSRSGGRGRAARVPRHRAADRGWAGDRATTRSTTGSSA